MAKGSTSLLWFGVAGIALLYFLTESTNADAATSVSSDQIQRTAALEGFSPTAYPDGSNGIIQNYSIGYGHQIQPGETNLLTATLTPQQGLSLLQSDGQSVTNAIAASGVSLTPGQYDAIWDFGYNAGIGAMNKVLQTLMSSGDSAAQSELMQYIYWHPDPTGPAVVSQNLVNRRNQEIATWNS